MDSKQVSAEDVTIKGNDRRNLEIIEAINNMGLPTDNIIIKDSLPENRKPLRDVLDSMQSMVKNESNYWYCRDAPKTCESITDAMCTIWRMYDALENKENGLWWRILYIQVKKERKSKLFMKSFKSPPGKSKEYMIKRKKFNSMYSAFIKIILDTMKTSV